MKHIHKIKRLTGIFLLLGLSAFIWKADPVDNLLTQIRQQLQTQRVNINAEKMYVHLDKTHYVAGETIWWKAYLVQASDLKSLTTDEVVQLDLLKPDGDVIRQIELKAENGKAAGYLELPDSLEAGVYQLVAYTNWMRNFDNQQLFRKKIRVLTTDAASPAVVSETKPTQIADVQFFPEGGDLIAGVPSRLAFKAISSQGLGVDVKGRIVDEQGNSLTDFESMHAGMGAVLLTPQGGKQYKAIITRADGSELTFELPEVKAEGYAMAVDEYNTPEQLTINLHSNGVQKQPLLLTIIANDAVEHSQKIQEINGQLELAIDKKKLPAGINRITLATAEGRLLAERLVFMHPDRQLQLSVSMNEPDYLKREKVQLTIEARDTQGKPVPANLSLAVTDAELIPADSEQRSIYAHLLLNSDLKGHIEQPDYYFKDITSDKRKALSYVMMTHGWRRFEWESLVNPEQPAFAHPRKAALSIDGRLVKENGDAVENGEVILYVKDQHEIFIVEETDEEGYFSFEGFDFQDSVEMVIQGTTAKGNRNVQVLMEEQTFTPEWQDIPSPMQSSELMASTERFVNRSANQAAVEKIYKPGLKEMLLKEIVVQERRENIVEPFRLHQRADVVIDAESLPVAPSGNVLESLQGRIPGVRIFRNGMYDYRAVIRGSGSPLYLLDGMPVDASALTAISQFDLERIEVLKGPSAAIYGGRGGGGVIALFSKRGGTEYEEVEPGDNIILYRAGGFQQYREFYQPRYTAEGQTDRPDYRTTLHWEPNVQTDASGKATVSFFTADRATDYRVVINGITGAGLPGFAESSFAVVKPEEVSP